jgi:uracil-DNA glycosylase
MAWSEHQHAQLRAMGLRLWSPPVPQEGLAGAAAVPASDAAAESVSEPPPAPARAPSRQPLVTSVRVAEPMPARATAAGSGALSTLGWAELRAAVAQCQACTLCESRTQTVFGVGHEQAQWMVVGEAPGENEDKQGEPFVGAAGQLLDRMLAALKLTRSSEGEEGPPQRVYIANTLKCRPPRNRNPSPEEMAQCEPFLVRQIELLKPRIILAMGRFAVQALLRSDEPIGRLRGRVHHYQGVPLVVTYHPAYLLRSPLDKAKAWDDLCLAADVAEGLHGSGRP